MKKITKILVLKILVVISTSVKATHIAKIDNEGFLNAIDPVKTDQNYFLVGSEKGCFQYKKVVLKTTNYEEEACTPSYRSSFKSNKKYISTKSVKMLPLNLMLDGCNYRYLNVKAKKIENSDKESSLYEKVINVDNGRLIAELRILGKIGDSILSLPEGKVNSHFILKKEGKVILNKTKECCDSKKDINQCEFYEGKCLEMMNNFDYVLEHKTTKELFVVDRPEGLEGFKFRLSKIVSNGLKELYKKSIYGVGGCR